MRRDDDSRFLLYITPPKEEKLKKPIEDGWTELIENAFANSKNGIANYMGLNIPERFVEDKEWWYPHTTNCGEESSCQDYLLENGMMTNSLCVFYVKWYRNSIPESDQRKLEELAKFYKKKIKDKFVKPEKKKKEKK